MPAAFVLAVMLASTCFLAAAIAQTRAEHELRGLFGSDAQLRRIGAIADRATADAEREVRLDAFAHAVSGAGVRVIEAGSRSVWELPGRSRWVVYSRRRVTTGSVEVMAADQHAGWLVLTDGRGRAYAAVHDATPV